MTPRLLACALLAFQLPAAQGIPAPGPATGGPYAPQPIVAGGIVLTLYPPDSPFLKKERIAEPEVYNMQQSVPGRIQSIVNIHNPSIEFHPVDKGINTGALVILVPGAELGVDPRKIGIVGFSAGAELAAPSAVQYETFDAANSGADPLASASSRPDFVGLVYPGPTPFTRAAQTPIPAEAPPTFIVSAGSGDAQHAIWADDYFRAFLTARVPNLEMHIYGNGVHANGMKDRNGEPFGTWHERFIDWFRDLGFLQKPGVETKAGKDAAAYAAQRRTPREP